MIRLKWGAICLSASALLSGNALAQTFFWTGDASNANFTERSNWRGGAVPTAGSILGFNADIATGSHGSAMTLNENFSARGLDIEGGVSNGDTIAINAPATGVFTLTLGPSGITINTTSDPRSSSATINVPVALAGNQTWEAVNSDLAVNGAISQTASGTALTLMGGGNLSNFTLNSGASTYSGGTTITGGAGTIVVVGAGTTGPAGAPTSGPLGTGTITLANGVSLETPSTKTLTIANNISIGAGAAATVNIEGGAGGGIILTGTISDGGGPGTIQAISLGSVEFDAANTYSGGTIIEFSTAKIANDRGLGTGPLTAFDSTLDFTSSLPSLTNASFTGGSTLNFTAASGGPSLTGPTLAGSTVNFADSSTVAITDMADDGPGSTNVLNLGSSSTLNMRVDTPTTYYGTITGTSSSVAVTTGGSGTLELYGANTYSGGTTVEANVLVSADNNSALGSGTVTVNGGALGVGSGVTLSNAVTFVGGSSLEGYGTISPPSSTFFTIRTGGEIAGGKGSSTGFGSSAVPGTLTFGANAHFVLGGAGILQFSIMNDTGTVGTDFSAISAPNSSLSVTALQSNPFTIQLVSVNPATGQTGLANFNDTVAHSWTLLSALSISNFAAGEFTVDDTTDFQNPLGGGTFSVSEFGGNTLKLNFTPVPEPATWALMATGMCALCAAAFRRRRRS